MRIFIPAVLLFLWTPIAWAQDHNAIDAAWTADNKALVHDLWLSKDGLASIDCDTDKDRLKSIVTHRSDSPLPCGVTFDALKPIKKKWSYVPLTSYDEKTKETAWQLSANGKRWWSCKRDVLIVRSAKSAKVLRRHKGVCDFDQDDRPSNAPLPSPDGSMGVVQTDSGLALIRAKDGKVVLVEEGMTNPDVKQFFGVKMKCKPAPKETPKCKRWVCDRWQNACKMAPSPRKKTKKMSK